MAPVFAQHQEAVDELGSVLEITGTPRLGGSAVAFGGLAFNASPTAGLRHVPRLLGLALEGTWTTPCHVALPQIPQPFGKSGHLTHLLQCEVALERGQSWCAETGWMAQLMP